MVIGSQCSFIHNNWVNKLLSLYQNCISSIFYHAKSTLITITSQQSHTRIHRIKSSRAEPRTEYTTKPSTNERIPPNTSPGHSWRNTLRTVHFSLFYSSLTVKTDFHLSYIDPPYVIIGSYPTDTTPIAPPLTFQLRIYTRTNHPDTIVPDSPMYACIKTRTHDMYNNYIFCWSPKSESLSKPIRLFEFTEPRPSSIFESSLH